MRLSAVMATAMTNAMAASTDVYYEDAPMNGEQHTIEQMTPLDKDSVRPRHALSAAHAHRHARRCE